ncbi:MAG: hypothetical protein GY749_35150 [Desulfobacteraceae bacterium]|nr:hypothetical protein [Desulfobacteraceae bacterium]
MNLGTDILAKIMDEAKSMTVKEYEELFEDSQQLEEIDIVHIEIRQLLFLKPPVYSYNVYDSFTVKSDL